MNRDGHTGGGGASDAHPTEPIQRPRPGSSAWRAELTEPIPAVAEAPSEQEEQTRVITPVGGSDETGGNAGGGKKSLIKATGSMAIATLISRITGFGWKLVLAWIVGLSVVNGSFTAANNLPNIIFELLVGGVLTSVIVPVLVRAQKEDSDGGQAYIQRLLSLSVVVLVVGTALAVIAAPVLITLYVSDSGEANRELATSFAYLLLPQIFFYGLNALFGAILQSRQIFGPPAWAPVVHNLVIFATLGVYSLLPGDRNPDSVQITDAQLLTLGLGVTLGVVAQAAIQLPALRRAGFRLRWRWEWDSRLNEFGKLAAWMVSYVLISQIGLMAISQVATTTGSLAVYSNAWLLLQLPYGVLGFSIMTAILPRMSAAAADGDDARVVEDLSMGNRLSAVLLLPISAVMTALGSQLGIALFAVGKSQQSADQLGLALAVSAFGLLPYAITMMQMRVFYAMKDARTPTMIMVLMTAVKVPLAYLCPVLLSPENVVLGLAFVNSLCFVLGWVAGEALLRRRLGSLNERDLLTTLSKTLVAALCGGAVAWLIRIGVDGLVPGPVGTGTGWLQLVFGGTIGLAAVFAVMWLLKVAELQPVMRRLGGVLRRR
ncbi:putative peptidoglycan lipid II flippase [Saccharopolyspora lacisalsi]|uniref:Putative peptidoglycan lipid II flippase n=1 Tax=Halosaccharopolyspora lacisalsi TaxID=1000566 RepID=A0A839E730_9PSEU|nr:murein biosynthesis integral membrane protein MurJ [Halosaccharopolyspora lacisalsi]MBA8827715.1 putative peptidoglycan lipid II flippase [Halosaccharopolyspora lacisalsi]